MKMFWKNQMRRRMFSNWLTKPKKNYRNYYL
jgi:hypothetical protein